MDIVHPNQRNTCPQARKGKLCALQKLLVFFGGYYCSPDIELETFFNDIEVLDIENMEWTKTSRIEGPEPPARFSHTASMFGEYMVVFGGEENHNKYDKMAT
jgi:hypothetical protein